MTPFEIIILFMYWQFATTYTYKNVSTDIDGTMAHIANILSSMTIGAFLFPAIFANSLWDKLNK